MLEYKTDFIVEYTPTHKNKRGGLGLKLSDFCISFFNDYQKQFLLPKALCLELWGVKQYKKDVLVINPLKKLNPFQASSKYKIVKTKTHP